MAHLDGNHQHEGNDAQHLNHSHSPDVSASDQHSIDGQSAEDKLSLFDLQVNRLQSAKQELIGFMRSDKELTVKKYEDIVQHMKHEFHTNETHLKQTIDHLKNELIKCQQKSSHDMNEAMDQLKHSTQELVDTKHTVSELQSAVKQKDLSLNELQNSLKKCETDLTLKTIEFEKHLNDLNNSLIEMKTNRDLTENELNLLKTRLNSVEMERQSISSSLSMANEKVNSLETKCETLLVDNQRLKQTNESELKAKHESMDRIKSLTNALNDNQTEILRLQKNWSELEKTRIGEIDALKQDLTLNEQQFREQMNQMTHEKNASDKKSVNDINSLLKKLQEMDDELHRVRDTSEKRKQDMESVVNQMDQTIVGLESDKTQIQTDLNNKITNLTKQLEESDHNLSEMSAKRDKALSQLTQTKTQLMSTNNEKEVLKTSLINANEKCYSFEFKIDSLNNEISKYIQLLENESKEKREKTELIETITDSLREKQAEVERLNKSMKELEKSCKEFEESRTSVMDDCNELRTTLMEVEKSRLDIRRELNDYKINSSSLENKLKSKDNELQDVKRRLEAIKNERNSLKDSLDSSSKSLTQLKDMNTNLTQRNKQLMAQMSFSENERREFEKQLSFSSTAITDRENNVSLLKKDNESLKELVKKLENEKKRLERSYSLIEKEKYVLKNSLDDFQRKSSKVFDNSHNNHSNDVIIDEAKIITQGLAALELKNIELQRKVQGLQSLMNETEGLNGTDSDHPVNGSASDDLQRLRLAQKHAEELIDRKDFSSKHLSNYEKELSRFSLSPSLTTTPPRFKEPPIRSHSVSRTGHLKHQNTDTSTPLPSYSSTSGSNNAKRKLNYNKN